MSQTSVNREKAVAFVDAYGRTWESWDVPGFVDLFSDEVVYIAHATKETIVGRTALESYLRKEAAEQGEVPRMRGGASRRCRRRTSGRRRSEGYRVSPKVDPKRGRRL
jgi:hypothetical protein